MTTVTTEAPPRDWTTVTTELLRIGFSGAKSTIPIRMRNYLRSEGLNPVPFGDGDTKTGAPSTYRRVGATCPATCPYLNGCYATVHHVGRVQRTASDDRDDAVASALACMVWAMATDRQAARLHVSGDFGVDRDDSVRYLTELARGMDALRLALRNAGRDIPRTMAWTYTHHEGDWVDGWVSLMSRLGLHIRRSDHYGVNGAVVHPFDDIGSARARSTAPVAKCPAQLRDTTCAECRLCWERPEVAIAFDPHGSTASRVRRAAEVARA